MMRGSVSFTVGRPCWRGWASPSGSPQPIHSVRPGPSSVHRTRYGRDSRTSVRAAGCGRSSLHGLEELAGTNTSTSGRPGSSVTEVIARSAAVADRREPRTGTDELGGDARRKSARRHRGWLGGAAERSWTCSSARSVQAGGAIGSQGHARERVISCRPLEGVVVQQTERASSMALADTARNTARG